MADRNFSLLVVSSDRTLLRRLTRFLDVFGYEVRQAVNVTGVEAAVEAGRADFLVVDVSKPFAEESYFEIERSLLRGVDHVTFGGRSLNDDIVDALLTLVVNKGSGPPVTDGVEQSTVPASGTFPYVRPANPNPPSRPGLVLPPSETAS